MKNKLLILTIFFLLLIVSYNVKAQSGKWRQIVLLKDQQRNVERILGKPQRNINNENINKHLLYSIFNVEGGSLSVAYSEGFCRTNEDGGWNLAAGIVTQLVFSLDNTFLSFDSLKLNLEKYHKEPANLFKGTWAYINDKKGIEYIVDKNRVTAIVFKPKANRNNLRCANIGKIKN